MGTKACTRWLLEKLQENIEWAWMKIKSSKSRSISIIKERLSDHCFFIGEEPIPTVTEKPVKSLSRWYDATFKDKELVDQLRWDTFSKSLVPGRLKLF